MERLFVYRTAPQKKFQLRTSSQSQRPKDIIKNNYSEKCISTESSEKILFKTKTNILLHGCDSEDNIRVNRKLVQKPKLKRQMSQRTLKKPDNSANNLKFHQVTFTDLRWQKWKQPQNFIRSNKKNLTHRQFKRIPTQPQNQTRQQRQISVMRSEQKEKQIQRKTNQMNRLRRIMKEKKQVISLMNSLYQAQKKAVSDTFGGLRMQVEKVVDYYKKQQLNYTPLKRVKRGQLY